MSKKSFVLASAAAALFVSGHASAESHEDEAKVECQGVNSCKGQSACKTAESACAGKNECAGKGFLKLTQEECDAAKGEQDEG